MSSSFDGMTNIYNLTAQINSLKQIQQEQAASGTSGVNQTDVNNQLLSMEQNFSAMLNSLVNSSDDEDETNANPFAFLTETNQQVTSLTNQAATNTTTSQTPTTTTVDPNILATQYKLNLNNIF